MSAESVPSVPPIACQPWCQDGDGHRHETHPDNRYCQSEPARVGQSLVPYWRDISGEWNESIVDVSARVGPTRVPSVLVWLYNDANDTELILSPAEARAMAAHLLTAADHLDGRGAPGIARMILEDASRE